MNEATRARKDSSDNTSDDCEGLSTDLEKSQANIAAVRRKLRFRQDANAEKMKNRLKKHVTVVDYTEGDFVLVLVPKIDRSGTDSKYLPAQVHEVISIRNGHKKYRILSRYGMVDVCYAGDELKPSTIEIECPPELLAKKVALSTAARAHNSRTSAVTTSCRCKTTCLTKHCKCRKSGYSCSTHCHAFSDKCLNKD